MFINDGTKIHQFSLMCNFDRHIFLNRYQENFPFICLEVVFLTGLDSKRTALHHEVSHERRTIHLPRLHFSMHRYFLIKQRESGKATCCLSTH